MDAPEIERAKTAYYRASEEVEWIVTDALCATYKKVTGKPVTDRIREALFDAIRFQV